MLKELISIYEEIAITVPAGQDTHQELNFGMLLEPKLRKLFYETYDEVPEQYSKLFHVLTSKKAKETDYGLGAMSPWTEFGSSTAPVTGATSMPVVPYQTIDSGLERTYTHKEFASGFIVERKFADDEMYSVIEKMPKDLARAGRYKVETDAITLFNNAFSKDVGGAGKSAIYDGLPLISASHPIIASGVVTDFGTGVASNLIVGALSDITLKNAIILGQKQLDEAGKLIQMHFDTLVVPPQLQFLAEELLRSTQKIGTANNDINSLKDAMKVVVNPFLTDSDAWYIMDSKRHQLNYFWRVKPEFKREEDFESLAAKYRGYMRYSFGCSDWRGIIGSAGV